jgi:hypothetical protein
MYHLTEDSLQKKDADVVSLMVARDTAEQRAETAALKVVFEIFKESDSTLHYSCNNTKSINTSHLLFS